MMEIKIANRLIGKGNPPFIIAEMSGNHNRSLVRAMEIVKAAASTGVHALKLQTYTPDTMTLDSDEKEFFIDDPKSIWKGKSLYDLYKEAYTPWEWHEPIFRRCHELGLICFSSPFDKTAVDFLEKLNTPCYKIASFEITDIPLIRNVAKTGKPVIISTGMATASEIGDAVHAARENGCNDLVLLKCTSTYPASPEDSNILTIPHMRELFECEVGLSDHTLGIGAAIASVALGATVIEKHFTLSREDAGIDTAFSMESREMRSLVIETERARKALGRVGYGPTEKENGSLVFRRSLYVVRDMRAGEIFSKDNVRAIRPGKGLLPKYIDVFMGRSAKMDVKKGTPLSFDFLG